MREGDYWLMGMLWPKPLGELRYFIRDSVLGRKFLYEGCYLKGIKMKR